MHGVLSLSGNVNLRFFPLLSYGFRRIFSRSWAVVYQITRSILALVSYQPDYLDILLSPILLLADLNCSHLFLLSDLACTMVCKSCQIFLLLREIYIF